MKKIISNNDLSSSGEKNQKIDPDPLFPMNSDLSSGMDEDLINDFPDEKELLDDDLSEEDELLISWLEKELTGDQRSLFEKRLAESAELRKKLEDLRTTWDLLDSLQVDPAGKDLARSTMEIIAVAAQDEIAQKQIKFKKSRRFFRAVALSLILLTICGGGIFGMLFFPDPGKQIEKDIPVIFLLDQLESVDNFHFLVRLKETGLFLNDVRSFRRKNDPSERDTAILKWIVSDDPIPYSQEQLQQDPNFPRLFMKFGRLTPSRKKDVRHFYHCIISSPEKSDLLNTMENYYNWFCSEVHETVRDEIAKLPADKKLNKIQYLLKEYQENVQKRWEMMGKKDWSNRNFSQNSRNSENPFPFKDLNSRENDKKKFRFHEKLPQELRNEDLSSFKPEFDEFMKKRSQNISSNHPKEMKREGFFQPISEFITSKTVDHFMSRLTPDGEKYMRKLPDREQIRMIGLLFTMELHKNMDFRNPESFSFGKNGDKTGSEFGYRNNPWKENGYWNRFRGKDFRSEGGFRMNESTSELAETLRKLPQKQRDELLSLPAEEMYAQLLILHWGFAPQKGMNRFSIPAPPSKSIGSPVFHPSFHDSRE